MALSINLSNLRLYEVTMGFIRARPLKSGCTRYQAEIRLRSSNSHKNI